MALACDEFENVVIADDTVVDQVLQDNPDLVQVICTAIKQLNATVGNSTYYLEVYFDKDNKPQFYLVCETTLPSNRLDELESSMKDWMQRMRRNSHYNVSVSFETIYHT